MPQEPSSRPQSQHWKTFLGPWEQHFHPVLGVLIGRAQVLPVPAPNESQSPIFDEMSPKYSGTLETS